MLTVQAVMVSPAGFPNVAHPMKAGEPEGEMKVKLYCEAGVTGADCT